jgi:Uma2 family endonuclease
VALAGGIGEFWLIDLVAERIVAHQLLVGHQQPAADCFQQMRIFLPGEEIAPQAFPDILLSVAKILGI